MAARIVRLTAIRGRLRARQCRACQRLHRRVQDLEERIAAVLAFTSDNPSVALATARKLGIPETVIRRQLDRLGKGGA